MGTFYAMQESPVQGHSDNTQLFQVDEWMESALQKQITTSFFFWSVTSTEDFS